MSFVVISQKNNYLYIVNCGVNSISTNIIYLQLIV
jgi:hypothetical protein